VTRGWEDLPLDIIELRIDKELRHERLSLNRDTISDSSSTVSGFQYAREPLISSPLRAPLYSDSVGSSSSGWMRKLCKKVCFELGPDILSFHKGYVPDDDKDDLLSMHSLKISSMKMRSSPPLGPGCGIKTTNQKFRQKEDLPPLANHTDRSQMCPPSTPLPRQLVLQSSSMMTTLGFDSLMPGFRGPDTLYQTDDFSDFVNFLLSLAQNA
jgi:hypothetical protein